LSKSFILRSGMIVLCALSGGAYIGLRAQSQPSAERLLHLFYVASGGDNWNHLTQAEASGTIVVGGAAGTFHQIVDLKNGRDVTQIDVGPLHQKQATLTEASWEVDGGGLATFHDAPEARADAINQSFLDRNGWFHAAEDSLHFVGTKQDGGATYDLVSVTLPGGRPMALWLDEKDHLLKQIVQEDANHQQNTIFFSDYRKIDGVLYPFSQRQSTGDTSQDTLQTVRTIHFSPATNEAAFQPPHSKFDDAKLLGQQASAKVPFTIVDGAILVQVSIDGHAPLPFLLDTGGQNYVTPETAKLLGIGGVGNIALSGVGAQQENAQFGSVKEMQVGPAKMLNQQFIVGPLPAALTDRGKEPPIAGLVGYELLRRFPTTFNYQKRMLTFWAPGSTVNPPSDAQSLRLYFDSHTPSILAAVDGISGYFDIDTGNNGVTTLFGAFYHVHLFPVEQPAQNVLQAGVGGTDLAILTRVGTLTIGSWSLERPLVTLSFAKQGAFSSESEAGNLGDLALRNFVFTLDYEHRRIFLQKADGFGEATPYNRGGMTLERTANRDTVVKTVNANAPAAEAGLAVGDVIVSINGQKPDEKSLADLQNIFLESAGTPIEVRYKRGGKEAAAKFQLRELLPLQGNMLPLSRN
jgi:hypothetical protein